MWTGALPSVRGHGQGPVRGRELKLHVQLRRGSILMFRGPESNFDRNNAASILCQAQTGHNDV